MEYARRPIPHSDDIPVPLMEKFQDSSDDESSSADDEENSNSSDFVDASMRPFSQNELNDLIRDLNLPKMSTELLASRLKERNLLSESCRITFYRNRHEEYLQFFAKEKDFV